MSNSCFEVLNQKLNDCPLTIDLVKTICVELTEHGNDDPEWAHAIEDKVHQKFIQLVITRKLTIDEIEKLAIEIANIDNIIFPRWYA